LNLDEHFFEQKFDRHITAMRLNFYAEQTSAPAPGQLRAGAHTDYGAFTILNGESVPGGLEVRAKDGQWIPVETDPQTFVVNIGDLLMRWTNDPLDFQHAPSCEPGSGGVAGKASVHCLLSAAQLRRPHRMRRP